MVIIKHSSLCLVKGGAPILVGFIFEIREKEVLSVPNGNRNMDALFWRALTETLNKNIWNYIMIQSKPVILMRTPGNLDFLMEALFIYMSFLDKVGRMYSDKTQLDVVNIALLGLTISRQLLLCRERWWPVIYLFMYQSLPVSICPSFSHISLHSAVEKLISAGHFL